MYGRCMLGAEVRAMQESEAMQEKKTGAYADNRRTGKARRGEIA